MTVNSDLPPAYPHCLKLRESFLDITKIEDQKQSEAQLKGDDDDEAELLVSDSFEDKTVRLGFIQKVLTIKILQLIGVALIMALFKTDFFCGYDFRMFMRDNFVHLLLVSTVAFTITLGMMACCDQARRQSPYKFVFLVAHPLTFAFFIASATYWDVSIQFTVAFVNHCVTVFTLLVYSAFAMQTKIKFITLHGTCVAIGVQLVLFAISVPIMYSATRENGFYVLYPSFILTLEQIYILFDLQVMTSEGYRTTIKPDDYVDGAVQLHIDYGYIFVKYLVPKMRTAFYNCIH